MHPFAFRDETAVPWIIGHRGAAGYAPENTLESFRLGWDLGADLLELDLRLTSDSQFVALHDADLGRVAGVQLSAEISPAESLRRIYPVPTLEEILASTPRGRWLNLELKCSRVDPARLARCFVDRLQPVSEVAAPAHKIIASSFDFELLRELRALAPELPLVPIADRDPEGLIATALQLGSPTVHAEAALVTPELYRAAQVAGVQIWAFTVNQPETARRLVRLGVRGLFTDVPDRLRAAFI